MCKRECWQLDDLELLCILLCDERIQIRFGSKKRIEADGS